jgi:hypothetical protein|nr:MAG TPA: hypothetical protein [Caudoviricetes sp.]
MERLTKREISGITYNNSPGFICSCYCDNCSKGTGDCDRLKAMVNRLAKFEDLEEQGLLVRLPCKVGDILFRINKGARNPIIKMKVSQITMISKLYNIKAIQEDYGEVFFSDDVIGIKVFTTSEEAEKKLEELGNDKT